MQRLEKWNASRPRVRKLPRWAGVVFACRCARRALVYYPGRPWHLKILLKAIRAAERAARTAAPALSDKTIEELNRYYTAEGGAGKAGEISTSYYSAAACYAAFLAATDTSKRGHFGVSCVEAADMAILAATAFCGEGHAMVADLVQSILGDLMWLEMHTVQYHWNDHAAVPKSVFSTLAVKRSGAASSGTLAPCVTMVLKGDSLSKKIEISVHNVPPVVSNEIMTRITSNVGLALHDFYVETRGDEPKALITASSSAPPSELLTERAYRLLKRLATYPHWMNQREWISSIISRAHAKKYIHELEVGQFVQKKDGLYAVTPRGHEYLRTHIPPNQFPRAQNA